MTIKRIHGFTFIEALITVCILGIALVVSTPSLLNLINKNKTIVMRDELLSALSLARSTAITTGSWATVCSGNARQTQCNRASDDWSNGWLVFSDKNRNGRVDKNERIISVKGGMTSGATINATNNRITYDSQGIADGYQSTFLFCSQASQKSKPVGIHVSSFGRLREITSNDKVDACNE